MDFGQPLQIDRHLTVATRILPSPMAGVMTPVFCRAASKLQLVKNWFTPFLSITAESVPSMASLKRKLEPFRNDYPAIVQLLGHDAPSLAEAAGRLVQCGISAVNLNFACPMPQIQRSHNGGILLKDPDKLFEVASAVVNKVGSQANVSVKIRTGVHSPDEMKTIADALYSAGIRFFICHFRTVDEMYDPVENPLDRLTRLREILPPDCVLFGNGDIVTRADAENMCNRAKCDGVTAGRALLSNPFLLKCIADGGDAVADDEQRYAFLKATVEAADSMGVLCLKWLKTGFLEFARMAFGADSKQFRQIVDDPGKFVGEMTDK